MWAIWKTLVIWYKWILQYRTNFIFRLLTSFHCQTWQLLLVCLGKCLPSNIMKIIVLYNILIIIIVMLFYLDCLIFINISYLFFYFIHILFFWWCFIYCLLFTALHRWQSVEVPFGHWTQEKITDVIVLIHWFIDVVTYSVLWWYRTCYLFVML